MIRQGDKVRILSSPRPESQRFVGMTGEVRGPIDANGVFEVRFRSDHRENGRQVALYASAAMCEVVVTGIEKEAALENGDHDA